jgi:CubicO group peptidase (beta-lactamase class C family)
MSKPITAAGALLLVERGQLVLDEPISTYLPQFAGRSVLPTVLDLLRHTAGMPEGLLGDSSVHKLYAEAIGDGMTDLTGEEFIGKLSTLPLLHEPGKMWHYGWGLDLTGLIIESVVGTSLGNFLRDEVCTPLKMPDTTFGVPEGYQDRFAQPLPEHVLPDLSIARFHSGGAGLVSTAGDYLRFVQMLLGEVNRCSVVRLWSTCCPISSRQARTPADWRSRAGTRGTASVSGSRYGGGSVVRPPRGRWAR